MRKLKDSRNRKLPTDYRRISHSCSRKCTLKLPIPTLSDETRCSSLPHTHNRDFILHSTLHLPIITIYYLPFGRGRGNDGIIIFITIGKNNIIEITILQSFIYFIFSYTLIFNSIITVES